MGPRLNKYRLLVATAVMALQPIAGWCDVNDALNLPSGHSAVLNSPAEAPPPANSEPSRVTASVVSTSTPQTAVSHTNAADFAAPATQPATPVATAREASSSNRLLSTAVFQ